MDLALSIRIIEEKDIAPGDDAGIRQLLCLCFPADAAVFSKSRHWHASAPAYSLLAEQRANLLGHVGIVIRDVRCAEQTLTIAGVQNMAVHPNARRTGLGRRLLDESMREAARRDIKWGLLFCAPSLQPFYRSAGWEPVHTAIRLTDQGGVERPLAGKNSCLARPLGAAKWPAGEIHLGGPDW